jgi:PAS domain S-box-containing protein
MKSASVSFEAAGGQPRASIVNSFSAIFDWRLLVIGFWVFAGYYLGARIGLALTFQPHPVSVLWPANSILVAALLLTPPRIWWFVLLAAFPAHWAAQLQSHVPPLMILCWFISNSCEAVISAGLTRYLVGGPIRFRGLRDAGIFCLCAVVIGPFLSSFLDAAFVVWNHWGQDVYWKLIRIRFSSNVLAALVVVPLIVTWARNGIARLRRTRLSSYLEPCVLFLSLFSVSYAVLYESGSGADSALLFLPLPFLLWAAIRFGSLGASSAISIVSFLAIWSGSHGHGPFSGGTAEQNALSIQIFQIALAIPLLFLGAVIEERTKGAAQLRESEERMSLAMEAANLGLWEWNVRKDELWGSKERRAQLGLPASGKLKLEDGLSRVHVDDRDRVRQTFMDAVKTGKNYHVEYRVVLPDGSVRWTDHRGRCVRGADGKDLVLRGVSMDATAQKQSQELFRMATEASPSGIVVIDNQGRIVLVNSHVEELFGYNREELLEKRIESLVPERFASQHPEHRARFLAAPTARAMGVGRELFGRRKDGSEFPVEIGLSPIQTPEGMLVLAAIVDISARKLAEADALQHREEVGHLSRVAMMGELTASIAHELNQPLAGIISNASAGQRFIDRGNVDLRELRELLGDIVADGRRAGEVIRGIRGIVKKSTPTRQGVNLNDLIMDVIRMMRSDATLRSCELKTLLDPDLPLIEGDPIQLQQVLLNLLANAFDAMRETPLSRRQVLIVTERNDNDTIGASVRDHGAGIPVEVFDRLFDHFFTTKEDGMGMGLAIVRSIVESHSGTIAVENIEGGGARFHFTLPINPARDSRSAV